MDWKSISCLNTLAGLIISALAHIEYLRSAVAQLVEC